MLALHIKRWFAAAALALIALMTMASAAGAEPQTLRLMTYNIRLDLASDGVNAWPHRREWVAEQIQWLRPDIFGLQEVLPHQKAELIAALPRYRMFGGGRDGKDSGESSPVGFDTGRFDFREGGMFWLSPTPDVPSRAWDAANRRIATWVRLRFRDSRADVLALNTHWDHIGIIARRQSAAQIIRWIESNARPCEAVVVLGDFNSTIDSEQMRAMTQGKPLLRDARAITKTAPFGPAGTFNAFRTAPARPEAIDHILVGERIDVERYAVISQVIEGRVPSDHFPVLADLRIASCR